MSGKRAVLYARVSGAENEDISKLDRQLAICREYAANQGYRVVEEFAEEEYSSGTDLDLAKLNQILDLARDGTFDILVCRELDHLARGIAKQLFIEDELKAPGV